MTDPIADMLNRIRNAQAVSNQTVEVPFSKLKYEIAKIMEKRGFVEKIDTKGKKNKKNFEIVLKYDENMPAISGLKRISKPGQRVYSAWQKLGKMGEGLGILIVSTSKGLMTGREAKQKKIGGEVICHIW